MRAADLEQAATGEAELNETVRRLVHANQARIFRDGAAPVEIDEVALGAVQHRREDRAHRALTIRYRSGGVAGARTLWLKLRPGLDRLYPLLASYDQQGGAQTFPTPYFAGQCPGDDIGFIVTEFAAGEVLRNRLVRLGALRQSARLAPVFAANGAKMRQFHDACAPTQAIAVDAIVAQAARLTRETPHFTAAEKQAVLAHLADCHSALPMAVLPAVTLHNDWVLKNIIVARDGADLVIDCDSMRHPPNWRWFDVVYLLLNVESQQKWRPLVTAAMVERLWQEFWRGYIGAQGLPDGLTREQLAAILYIVRIEWLVGGTVREPYFEIMNGRVDRRYLCGLKESVLRGRYSLFEFLDAG
jgi:hypothetical protein